MKLINLSSVLRVPSVMSAATYAVAGLGFAFTTVVMGRVLSEQQFALAVLIIALCNLGAATSASGINGIVVRHNLRGNAPLMLASACVAVVIAIGVTIAGMSIYQLQGIALPILFAATFLGGITLTVMSALQRAGEFQRMTLLSQSANGGLLLASLAMILGIGRQEWFPTLIVALVFTLVGIVGWRWSVQREGDRLRPALWRDALNFTGVAFAGEVMLQVERFLIPLALSLRELPVFAIVAAVVLAPYHMLVMGARNTLPARLRQVEGASARRSLLVRDLAWLSALSVLGGLILVIVGPFVCRLALPGVEFPASLIAAVVVSGMVRVLSALSQGLSGAVCEGRDLIHVHAAGWLSLLLAAILGFLLANFGLAGLIYGVTAGWLFRAIAVLFICRRHLH